MIARSVTLAAGVLSVAAGLETGPLRGSRVTAFVLLAEGMTSRSAPLFRSSRSRMLSIASLATMAAGVVVLVGDSTLETCESTETRLDATYTSDCSRDLAAPSGTIHASFGGGDIEVGGGDSRPSRSLELARGGIQGDIAGTNVRKDDGTCHYAEARLRLASNVTTPSSPSLYCDAIRLSSPGEQVIRCKVEPARGLSPGALRIRTRELDASSDADADAQDLDASADADAAPPTDPPSTGAPATPPGPVTSTACTIVFRSIPR